jgi:beta-phosphoglucomutase-like phosphatase (HAD superfamily)
MGVTGPCLVLDFDGTILDTEEPQYRAWAELWKEYGHDLSIAEWQSHIGGLDTSGPGAELVMRTGREIDAFRHLERRRRRAELQALVGLRKGWRLGYAQEPDKDFWPSPLSVPVSAVY